MHTVMDFPDSAVHSLRIVLLAWEDSPEAASSAAAVVAMWTDLMGFAVIAVLLGSGWLQVSVSQNAENAVFDAVQ